MEEDLFVDVNVQDEDGNTPLHLAVMCHETAECVDQLIAHAEQSSYNVRNQEEETPFEVSKNSNTFYAANRLRPLTSDRPDDTPNNLFEAANQNDVEALRRFLDDGADLNECDSDGDHALMKAIRASATEAVQVLIDAGMNVQRTDEYASPLHIAQEYPKTEGITKALLEAEAEVDPECPEGLTPMMYAICAFQWEYAKLLIDRGASCSFEGKHEQPLCRAVQVRMDKRSPNFEFERFLVQEGEADINAQDCEGNTALHYVAQNDEVELTKWLLENGADKAIENDCG